MRLTKTTTLIAICALAALAMLGRKQSAVSVWAQVQPGAPPAPLAPPPPPPGAVLSPAAMPTLVPLPLRSPVALASPTPTPRSFACSCFGPASTTRWMGTVQSQSYFQAREAAVNACLAYNFSRNPAPAFIPPPRFAFFPTATPAISSSQTEPGLPNLQAPGVSGFALLNSPRAILLRLCSECTCS